MSQFALLRQRRFWPLFWTQFFGAFNDNVFKNALVIFITYRSVSLFGLPPDMLVAACAGIFILPFFVFSATAGQMADRVPKPVLVRWVKVFEIAIMGLAALGFATFNVPLLLAVLFLMGTQSAFFGPTKYALLPELLDDRSLIAGNALVEMGTFLAILGGTIAGGLLIAGGDPWVVRTGWVVVSLAAVGLGTATAMKKLPAMQPDIPVQWDMVRPTWRILKVTLRDRGIRVAVLGFSWFWFMGASFLTILPAFTKDWLGGRETVVTLFLAMFCVGIAVGSLLCERLSRGRIELGLVPVGSLGISVFAGDLAWSAWMYKSTVTMASPWAFVQSPGGARIALDLFLVAVFSGLYTVPLYTLVQQKAHPGERSRVMAGNNILNSAFMVIASLCLVGLTGAGLASPGFFALLAGANLIVTLILYLMMPEFVMRVMVWVLATVVYRIRVVGGHHIPAEGAAILVSNHVSFIDWLLVGAACPRPPRFVIDVEFTQRPFMGRLLRDAKVIPIAPAGRDPGLLRQALVRIAAELEDGQLVVLFPEGGITRDGALQPFKSGIERLVRRHRVPVVPIALVGVWGSFFSRSSGRAFQKPFARPWRPVEIRVGSPVPAAEATVPVLEGQVASLGGWDLPER